MGGIGSGARRSSHIGNVEEALALDIRVLRRLDVVRTGECVCNTVHWSIGGLNAPSARLRVDLSDIDSGGLMTVTGTMPDGAISQSIAIAPVRSSLGGYRCYFICPITACRCEVLYYEGGGFASRQAQRLSYAVQNMGPLSRVRHKVSKLRKRLRGISALPCPRGQNRIEVLGRLRAAEYESKVLYADTLRALIDRSGTRRMPSRSR